jgi:hypothetical protein
MAAGAADSFIADRCPKATALKGKALKAGFEAGLLKPDLGF